MFFFVCFFSILHSKRFCSLFRTLEAFFALRYSLFLLVCLCSNFFARPTNEKFVKRAERTIETLAMQATLFASCLLLVLLTIKL